MNKYLTVFSLIMAVCLIFPFYTGCNNVNREATAESVSITHYSTGADPVTGCNEQVDLAWEQLCLATGYELQIAKDKDFTLLINPAVNNAGNIAAVTGSIFINMDSTNMTNPSAWIAPGTLPEAGAEYWWRIRVYRSATGQLAWSPWSEAHSFVISPGFIVTTPYYGVLLLSPSNGCIGCKVKPVSFSWSPYLNATEYQIDLSKDPEFKQMIVTATTPTTAYEYNGTLDYSTNYFWRVKAIEIDGQQIPSDWSATFSFQTEPAPAPAAPAAAEPSTPLWVWVIIAIGAVLVIATLILILRTRRS
ncbi:MAG: fibronectin type III domain-containing protein [Dehalococcoidia bacterium]|nr:fibronectin type III domain-containing protein [Dehalococcoidia bacterium]